MGCCMSCFSSSSCLNMRFIRLIYIIFLLIAFICSVAVQNRPALFNNVFWNFFPAYKQIGAFDRVWAFVIRFSFTFFVFHFSLFAFSLFQLSTKTVQVAKFFHRGLIYVKFIILLILFFSFFAVSNQDMQNFAYLSAAFAGFFQFFQLFIYAELFYLLYDYMLNGSTFTRICGILWIVVHFAVCAFCIIFVIVRTQHLVYIITTSIFCAILLIAYVLSSIPKSHGTAFVVSGLSSIAGIHYLRICAGNQPGLDPTGQTILNQAGIDTCNSFLLIFTIAALFIMNMVQITPRTLFIGSASPPDVADFASTLEDEDTRSGEASYYYWAFHLLMMQAACYMSQVYSFSGPRVLYGVNFGFGVAGSFVFLLYLAWTAFLPVVLKNRIFE
eukprot:EST47557.1 Transmembrane domain-containing protein [Spironucleus salmonicida]